MGTQNDLIKKYNIPVPRYTSYPTVPCWDVNNFNLSSWRQQVEKIFDETNATKGISLYIHLPFCESLCTYCACNTRITRNHAVEKKYIHAVLTEWELYRYNFGTQPVIREIHLGGGTPTFFSPENLRILIQSITRNSTLHPEYEFSFEGHPNNTTKEHLTTLYDLGFRRVSFGVQDFDVFVQKAINRIQPFENVQRAVESARAIGYESINFDLIYGLPFQTIDSISSTFITTLELQPDRIAFYSYAHVPWLKPGQRGYGEENLPTEVEKRKLYEKGKQILCDAGYQEIGMDHFALPHDPLLKAKKNDSLHRNFMGYTTSQTDFLLGLGVSAISDTKYGYAQNVKSVEAYQDRIANHELAISKGHLQTEEDLLLRECIHEIACSGTLKRKKFMEVSHEEITAQLREMQQEGIVAFSHEGMIVTDAGKAFTRNICSVFDIRLRNQNHQGEKMYSKSI